MCSGMSASALCKKGPDRSDSVIKTSRSAGRNALICVSVAAGKRPMMTRFMDECSQGVLAPGHILARRRLHQDLSVFHGELPPQPHLPDAAGGDEAFIGGSAILTGLLLAFNLPSNLPIWIVVIGSIVAIGIAKMSFGGLGNNLFNPALAGRVFLLISFPTQMTQWPLPTVSRWNYTDTETGATLLSKLKEEGGQWIEQIDIANLWIGNQGGSLGEVGAIALLIGFAYLLYRKIISWHIPVSILLTVFLFSFVLACGQETGNLQNIPMWQYAFDFALIQLLSGGLLLGAIYMATDYVTSPMTSKGMIIYGIGIGILTVVIRQWGGYPEGVSFAILIMNAFTPLINNYIKPKRFGNHRS